MWLVLAMHTPFVACTCTREDVVGSLAAGILFVRLTWSAWPGLLGTRYSTHSSTCPACSACLRLCGSRCCTHSCAFVCMASSAWQPAFFSSVCIRLHGPVCLAAGIQLIRLHSSAWPCLLSSRYSTQSSRLHGLSKDFVLHPDKFSIAALYVPTALGHAVPWHTRCSSPGALEQQQLSSCQDPRYFGDFVCLPAGVLLICLHGLHGSQNLGLNELPDCFP